MTCRATIKKSLKRGLWQIKEENHDLVSLAAAHDIIQKCMFLSGIDTTDRRKVHWFTYSDTQFDGCQLKLERNGRDFVIVNHEDFSGRGGFPYEMFKFFNSIPSELYIKIEQGTYNIIKQGVEIVDDK